MEEFIPTVRDAHLLERWCGAMSVRGTFRYFKYVLEDYPRERKRWFEFKDAQARQRVLDWLAEGGIELILESDQGVA